MISGFSSDSGQGSGELTPSVHCEKYWQMIWIYPLLRRSKRFKFVTNNKLPFLDMKRSWSPEGDLKFGVFRKNGHQFNYVDKGSIHTPSDLCSIPSRVLNHLAKITSYVTYNLISVVIWNCCYYHPVCVTIHSQLISS